MVLEDGRFLRIDDPASYAALRNQVKQVWDNGELVIGYGEFMENNKRLVPAGYTMDWWASDMVDNLSSEEDVAFFIETIGASREAWPEGTPGLPPEECDDPNAQFWVRCEWHERLRQLALTWPQALAFSRRFATSLPPPHNPWFKDLPIEWLPAVLFAPRNRCHRTDDGRIRCTFGRSTCSQQSPTSSARWCQRLVSENDG